MLLRTCLLLSLLIGCSALAHAGPRDTVTRVAEVIENEYFDEQRAKGIAAALRASAAQGEYDDATDPAVLAERLTQRLEPLDRHFSVRWSDRASQASTPLGPTSTPETDRQRHYGIARVEHLPGRIGYLDLHRFADLDFSDPDDPAKRAIDAALALLSTDDAVIIDLRRSPGGSPAMVGYLASAFAAEGSDIFNTFHGRGGRRMSEAPAVWHAAPDTQRPVYVLTSASTGSAAEALAYTLQQAKRAKTVGTRTYGAANPGGEGEIGEGFSVFVSVATPINPISKANWEETGVQPDLPCEAEQALRCAQRHLLAELRVQRPDDVALRWASEAITASFVPSAAQIERQVGRYDRYTVVRREEGLWLLQDNGNDAALTALDTDLYALTDNPSRRLRFQRDDEGKVTALLSETADGSQRRYSRS